VLGTPAGAATVWAHAIGFDLLVGRWTYLDARERGVPALIMAPVLVLTILRSPLGFLG
jgi:ABA4-like protein